MEATTAAIIVLMVQWIANPDVTNVQYTRQPDLKTCEAEAQAVAKRFADDKDSKGMLIAQCMVKQPGIKS